MSGNSLDYFVNREEILKEKESCTTVRAYPDEATVPPADRIVRYFLEKGRPVESLLVEEGRLDDVFRMITTSHSKEAQS